MTRSGQTTQQMVQAPIYAVYIWRDHYLSYPRDLARYLKREDLQIISPRMAFARNAQRLSGLKPEAVVIDHAFGLDGLDVEIQKGYSEWVLRASTKLGNSRYAL